MLVHSRSRILQVLNVVIVTIVSVGVGSVCSLAVDSRRLLEETPELHRGGQFQLVHWSHPQSPFHVPGVSIADRLKYAAQRSRERFAKLSMPVGRVASTNSSNITFVSPLSSIQGEYAMDISIGTPSQRFTAIADTGSDLVWVQCLPCSSGCANQSDPLFDPTKSSTYKGVSCHDPSCQPLASVACSNNTCEFQYEYGSGVISGNLAYEAITVNTTKGNSEIVNNFVFGCTEEEQGDFLNEDGLIGLGKGPHSFTSQLASLYGNKFSYCLVNFYDSSTKTSPILFGNSSIPTVPTQYTPMVQNPNPNFYGSQTFYYIGLKGISVNGVALNIPPNAFGFDSAGNGGVVSDSGTPVTYLVDAAYTPLLSTMQSLIKYPVIVNSSGLLGLGLCYNVTGVPNPAFPNVTIVFDGMSLDLPQANAFLFVSNSHESVNGICLAFGSATEGGIPFSIFGSIQQQNFQYLHDRENSRFGFAKVECDTISSG